MSSKRFHRICVAALVIWAVGGAARFLYIFAYALHQDHSIANAFVVFALAPVYLMLWSVVLIPLIIVAIVTRDKPDR